MKFATLVLIFITSSLAPAAVAPYVPGLENVEQREYDFAAGEKVIVENPSGAIQISVNERPRVTVQVTKNAKQFSERCQLNIEKSEFSEVIVQVIAPLGETCAADVTLIVPADVALRLIAGTGSINTSGTKGPLFFQLGTGSITASGVFTRVEGQSGTGKVEINGVTGGGSINAGNGPVDLKFLSYPKGDLALKTGSGDATLVFPKGTKINASLTSGTGQVTNEIEQHSSADFGLNAMSGTGNVKVQAY
ncbi:MAG TPA: DUF4097 family beta strand repeat-containing protein [Bdellovibrionales bacterium]|nr:DUF4097 family beta strand repeat-containing protein [Bdellovibrionales bacterium]